MHLTKSQTVWEKKQLYKCDELNLNQLKPVNAFYQAVVALPAESVTHEPRALMSHSSPWAGSFMLCLYFSWMLIFFIQNDHFQTQNLWITHLFHPRRKDFCLLDEILYRWCHTAGKCLPRTVSVWITTNTPINDSVWSVRSSSCCSADHEVTEAFSEAETRVWGWTSVFNQQEGIISVTFQMWLHQTKHSSVWVYTLIESILSHTGRRVELKNASDHLQTPPKKEIELRWDGMTKKQNIRVKEEIIIVGLENGFHLCRRHISL